MISLRILVQVPNNATPALLPCTTCVSFSAPSTQNKSHSLSCLRAETLNPGPICTVRWCEHARVNRDTCVDKYKTCSVVCIGAHMQNLSSAFYFLPDGYMPSNDCTALHAQGHDALGSQRGRQKSLLLLNLFSSFSYLTGTSACHTQFNRAAILVMRIHSVQCAKKSTMTT